MADEIYSSSYWGNGVCDNDIGWGGVYKDVAGCTPDFSNTYSMAFDGVNDFISTGYTYDAAVTPNLTLSFWFKTTSTALFEFPISIKTNGGLYNSSIVMIYGDNLLIQDRTGWVFGTNQSINDGNWHNVIVTAAYSGNTTAGTNLNMYLDGNLTPDLSSSTMDSGANSYLDGELFIGNFNGASKWYDCNVDEVAVWESILTSSNITSIYNSGVPTTLPVTPTAYYKMGDNGSYKSPQWLEPQNSNKDKLSNFSFEFDGVGDNISLSSNIDLGTLNTVSFWIKRNDTAIAQPFGNTTAWSDFLVRLQTTQISFGSTSFVFNDATTLSLVNQTTNWTHLMFVRNGSNCNLFVNGVDRDGAKTNSNAAAVNRFRTIGSPGDGSTWNFNGSIDEIALWTSDESSNISAIYNGGEPTTLPSGAVAHYKMGEEANFTDNWLVNNSALSNYSTRSFNFDGVDDFVNISNPIPLGLTSISFWMKSTDISGAKGITNGLGQLNFIGTSPIVRLNSTNYRYFADQVGNFDGNWHHWFLLIAGSGQSDITNSRLFVDGVEVLGSTAISNGLPLAWGVSQIGKGFYGSINASIDEFAIWQSDETANVSTIYNSGVPARIEGATSHWRMGEDATFNTNWSLPDNGSASNTGTSANMTIADLEGNAPNYTGGGLSNNMTIEDRVGDAPNSSNNSLSYNMDEVDRESDTP